MKHAVYLFLLLSFRSYSQEIIGTASDSSGKRLEYITIALSRAADSTVVKASSTNDKGEFHFRAIKSGRYLIVIKDLLHKTYYSAPINVDTLSKIRLADIKLGSLDKELDEVTVSALKKPIEFKNGNITINVEDSPLAIGNSVYDLLSQMPGVMVDNDNITIQGKSGVSIYIDDRKQPLTGQQLVNLLRGMSASSVEKIEIIKNPSAKYDAAGTAGIINIRSKKLKLTGWSGNLGYTYSRGQKSTNNADLSLNYKGRKLSLFSSIAAFEGTFKMRNDFYKTVPYAGENTILDSRSVEYDVAHYATVNLGLDWNVTPKNTIGLRFQGVPGYALRTREGNNGLSDDRLGYNNLMYKRTVPNIWYLANYNFNSEHLLDTNGTKLKFSADLYGPYTDIYHTRYDYRFTNNALQDVLPVRKDTAGNTIDLRVASARVDFERKLSKTLSFEAGVKAAYQDIYSDYDLEHYNPGTGKYNLDTMFTNRFRYHEEITAAYVNFQKEMKKWNYQVGLRAENTVVRSSSDLKAFAYQRQYFKLFPSLAVNYNPSSTHAWSLALNQRIWRPDYNNFNPYYQFNNLFSVNRGNPYLLPEIFYSAEISHSYKSKLNISWSYMYSESPIRPQSTQVDSTRVTYLQTANLIRSNESQLSLYYGDDIKKWWNINLGAGGWYYDFYGIVDGKTLDNYAFSYNGWAKNIFLLPGNFKIEIMAWFVGPWLYGGFYMQRPRGMVNTGIKRSFLDNKLTFKLSVNDIFFSGTLTSDVNFNNQSYSLFQTFDSRRFNAAISFDFGRIKVSERQVKRADEQGRLGK
jgi:iron complex outermembrane receptor protein